jgi:hypothetical protein
MQIKFGKMETKKELLDRVLLMMKYDSSKTLNENKKEIRVINEQIGNFNSIDVLKEQRIEDLKKIPENPQIKAAKLKGEKVEEIPYTTPGRLNWLNHQAESKSAYYKYPSQDFENVLFNFLNDISKMTLQQLVDFQLSYKRSITPGFIGFGKGSFADALVDNEIYLRRMKGEKGYPSDEFAKIRGQKPVIDKPSYSLLTGDVFVRFAPYIGKGAKQITTEKTQSYTDSVKKKKEKKAIDSGCLFKNETEGNAFRGWFNDTYPKLAIKNELDRTGKFCNSYINKVANAVFKEGISKGERVYDVYKSFFTKPTESEFKIPKVDITAKQDNTATYVPKRAEQQYQRYEYEKEKYEKYNKIFDFSKFPIELPLNKYNKITGGYGGYEFNYWTEPNTKIKVYIQGKTKDEVFEELINLYEEKIKRDALDKASGDPLIKQLFTQEEIDYALSSGNCDVESVAAFFQEIINGVKRNDDGNIVGKYYKDDKGNPYMAKWNSTKIPCDSVFWNEYGLAIQLGGMIAIAIATGGLGLAASTTFLIEVAADTALNLYSLSKSVEAQDKDAIKMDLAYVFLPFLMASAPVKSALKSAKFGDEVIESVETKLKTLPPNATKTEVDDLLNNMTPQEQRVIQQLGKEEYKDVVQKASKDVMDGLKKTADAPKIRKLSNPLVNILVYGAPAGAFFVKKISDIFKQKTGKSLTQKENELWGKALAFLDEESQSDLTTWMQTASKEQLLDIQNSPQMKSALLRTQNPENLSREEINKEGQEVLDFIKVLEEKSKLNLKTKESENEDLDFDEYDVDEWDKILGGSEQ